MRPSALAVAIVASLLAGMAGGAAPARRQQPRAEVVVTLDAADRLATAGKHVRVRFAVENRSRASLTLHNSLLFGAGLSLTGADGRSVAATERNAPGAAQQPLLLPAGGSVAGVIDLVPLFSEPCGTPGRVSVTLAAGGATSAPLELELRRDWAGHGARIVTDHGTIDLALDLARAPLTVANFLDLAADGFYDDLSFHRVVKGFMIQGGCPAGDGTGDGPRRLELEAGRGEGARRHQRGTISMAHKADPDSGSCQFFICHRDQPALDGNYAAFGEVVRGLEVVDAIAMVPCAVVPGGPDAGPSKPKQRVKIESVRPLPPDELAKSAAEPPGTGR